MKINTGLTSTQLEISITENTITGNAVPKQNILQPLYPKPKIWCGFFGRNQNMSVT